MTTATFPATPELQAADGQAGRWPVRRRPPPAGRRHRRRDPGPADPGGHVRYANLDYGASAPALSVVSAYLNEILPYYASVHRGAGYASQISTSVYENARDIVRDFVGGRPDDAVIFTRNTTDSLNLLAGCLPLRDGRPAGEVLYLDIEHHANLLPWQNVPHRSVVAAATLAATVDRSAGRARARRCQPAGRHRRFQCHRGDPADPDPGRTGARIRRQDRRRRRAAGPAPADRHRRGRRRLPRLLGAQALRPVRRRRSGGADGLARRRHPAPRRRRRRPRRPARLRQLDHRARPARGRLAERPRCGRPGPRHPGDRRLGPGAVAGRTRTQSGLSSSKASPGRRRRERAPDLCGFASSLLRLPEAISPAPAPSAS